MDSNELASPTFYNDLDMHTYSEEGGYLHIDYGRSLHVFTSQIRQSGRGLTAELNILYPDDNPIRQNIILNLQDSKARQALALELAGACPDAIPWDKVLEYVCNSTIEHYRGISEPEDMATEPTTTKVEYAIETLLPRNQPTTIFSPGGKGKSIFAGFIAVIYQHGNCPSNIPLIPCQGNVLYLDWESDIEQHRKYVKAIKAGLRIEENQIIRYLACNSPLSAIIESIRTLVKNCEIDLVIIDSQMGATAGMPQGMNEAQISSEYYNCLHSLKCTTLTIDHVTKEGMKATDGAGSPYGSVVKYNRARSIFELRSQQDTDSDHLELALIHQKFNLGRKQKPLGIAIDFRNSENGELEQIDFFTCDIRDNPELSRALSVKDRLIEVLKCGKLEVKAISEELDIAETTVRARLNGNKRLFKHFADGWGLLE